MSGIARLFNKFYDHGRRFVKIKPAEADRLIEAGATASYESGLVTITEPGQLAAHYPVDKHLHRRDTVNWVDEFNKRAAPNRMTP